MKTSTLLMTALLLIGTTTCSTNNNDWERNQPPQGSNSVDDNDDSGDAPTIPADPGDADDDELIPNSQEVNFTDAVAITFAADTVSVNNPFEGNGVSIERNGQHVVATSTVTDREVTYVLSGVTANGSLKIYGSYKFGLALNGAGITNPRGATINIQCKKKITLTLVDQTVNRLIDGSAYEYTDGEDMKGTLFSEGQLNVYGSGTLEVRGKNKHAICTDDYFRMYAGSIRVKEAASDGVHANDEVTVEGGDLNVRAAGDGVESEKSSLTVTGGTVSIVTTGQKGHGLKSAGATAISGSPNVEIIVYGNASKGISSGAEMSIGGGSLAISTSGDALYDAAAADVTSPSGVKCDGNMEITGGSITILSVGKGGKGISVDGELTVSDGVVKITTTGEQFKYGRNDAAAKAIKSDGNLTVNGGKLKLKTYGVEAEGLESKATLTINGGDVEIEAYDDAINAAKHIQINGGNIYCRSAVNDGIDCNGTLTIAGGVIVSVGASSPEEGFDCDNHTFKITGGTLVGTGGATSTPTASVCTQRSLVYNGSGLQIVRVERTSDGAEVLTFALPRAYSQNVCLLFSSPQLEASTGYTIYTGGSVTGGVDFHGIYIGATYAKGASVGTFTTTSMVTTIGSGGGFGGGGRR
jgi:hypothetical protein